MVADSKKTLRGKGQKLKQMHLVCLLQSILSAVLHILSGVVYNVSRKSLVQCAAILDLGNGQSEIPKLFVSCDVCGT